MGLLRLPFGEPLGALIQIIFPNSWRMRGRAKWTLRVFKSPVTMEIWGPPNVTYFFCVFVYFYLFYGKAQAIASLLYPSEINDTLPVRTQEESD